MKDWIFSRIQTIVADKLNIDRDRVTLDTDFRDDLGADSLDCFELLFAIEEEFGITIDDDSANSFRTIGEVVHHVRRVKNRPLVFAFASIMLATIIACSIMLML